MLLLDFDFKKGVLYRLARSRKPKDGDVREEPRTGENLDRLVERMYNGIYTIQGFSEQNIFQADNRIFAAIRELKDSYDYILIDTPPVGVLADVQAHGQCFTGCEAEWRVTQRCRGSGRFPGKIGDFPGGEHLKLPGENVWRRLIRRRIMPVKAADQFIVGDGGPVFPKRRTGLFFT